MTFKVTAFKITCSDFNFKFQFWNVKFAVEELHNSSQKRQRAILILWPFNWIQKDTKSMKTMIHYTYNFVFLFWSFKPISWHFLPFFCLFSNWNKTKTRPLDSFLGAKKMVQKSRVTHVTETLKCLMVWGRIWGALLLL